MRKEEGGGGSSVQPGAVLPDTKVENLPSRAPKVTKSYQPKIDKNQTATKNLG